MAKSAGESSSFHTSHDIRRERHRVDPSVVALAERYRRVGRLSFLAAVPNAFDFRAFTAVFHLLRDAELADCLTELEHVAPICKTLKPDVAVLSLSFPGQRAFSVGRDLLERQNVTSVAFFDNSFRFWQAYKALRIGPHVRYFTRELDANDLCRRMRTGIESSDKSFLSSMHHLSQHDSHGLLGLSSKEIEVMQWLTWGHSVRSVAEKLGLAESTIDNHKSSAMKKLNVHKATDLLRIAFEVGIVNL